MKGIGFKLRKVHVVGLSALLLVGAAILATASDAPIDDEHYLLGYHGFQINGSTLTSSSAESITARPEGERFVDRNGLSTLRLEILGMAGRGHVEGMGDTMYWLDKSRPVEGSVVRSKNPGAAFPAVHEMHFHLLLTTDAFPGQTFRSINPAIMVNKNSLAFPPKVGSRYALKQAVELESVDNPGEVVIRIVSNRNEIVGSGRSGWGLGRRLREN